MQSPARTAWLAGVTLTLMLPLTGAGAPSPEQETPRSRDWRPAAILAPPAFSLTAGKDGNTSLELVFIPNGRFRMGSPATESGRRDDEFQHEATVAGFYLMKTEVTQRLFESVMGTNPSARPECSTYEEAGMVDPDYPVTCVTWTAAVEFANALSNRDGLQAAYDLGSGFPRWIPGSTGYRLPTETEWEYAARAGSHTPHATPTPDEQTVCRYSNVLDATVPSSWFGYTHFGCSDGAFALSRVGRYAPNAWGLHDMIGNVSEWVWDWYGMYTMSGGSPSGPDRGGQRVIRGGSFGHGPETARVARRSQAQARYSLGRDLGFRLAQSPP